MVFITIMTRGTAGFFRIFRKNLQRRGLRKPSRRFNLILNCANLLYTLLLSCANI